MTPDQLAAAIREGNRDLLAQLNATSAGRASTTAASGKADIGVIDYLTSKAGSAADGLGRMTMGTFTAMDSINVAGTAISAFTGKFGGAFTEFVTGTTKYAFAINESLKDVNKSGYTFDQNLGAFAKSVLDAKMSIPEFQALIKDAGQYLVGLGTNANESGKTFLKLGATLQKDEMVQKMNLLGIGFEEFNQVLKIEAAARRNLNVQNENVQKNLINATIETVREMDLVAQMTGRSRQDQQKQQQDMNRRVNVQLARMSMTETQQASFTEAQKIAGYLGPAGQEAALIASTGGAMNADENRVMATLDATQRRLLEQLVRVQGQTPEANRQRDEIRFQMESRAADMARDQRQLELMGRLFRTGSPEEQARAQAYLQVAGGVGISVKKMQDEYTALRAEGKTEFATFREYRDNILATDRRRLETAGTPQAGAGALPAQFLNAADALQADINAAVAGVFKEGVEAFGTAATKINGLNLALTRFSDEDIKKIAKSITDAADDINKRLTRTGVETDASKVSPNLSDRARSRIEPAPKLNVGTKGVFGSWFNMFDPEGEMAFLHGEEAVIPKNKIGEFIRDMASERPDLINSIRGGLESALTEGSKGGTVSPELKSILEMMQNAMTQSSTSANAPTTDNSTMTELLGKLDRLNISMQSVKEAIELGSDKSVRAYKSIGNMI